MAENPFFPTPTLEGSPTDEPSQLEIPESVLTSVLSQWGYSEQEAAPDSVDEQVPPPAEGADDSQVGEGGPPEQEIEDQAPPPSPPGGPIFAEQPEPGEQPPSLPPAASGATLPDGRVVTPAELQMWAELNARIQSDPKVRQGLSELLNPQPRQVAPVAPQQPLPPLPQLSEDDLAEPAVRALVILAERQRQELEAVKAQVSEQSRLVQARQYQDSREVADGATSQFQRAYNLPDDIMAEVRDIAGRSNAVNLYMAGVDPQTGRPVTPDPFKAVESALNMAYWNSPRARVFEIERQSAHRSATNTRKQKLGGIGGSSGSAHRQPVPYDLSTAEGRHLAAVAEVTAAMGENE